MPKLTIGAQPVSKLYIGNQLVSKLMLGTALVWPFETGSGAAAPLTSWLFPNYLNAEGPKGSSENYKVTPSLKSAGVTVNTRSVTKFTTDPYDHEAGSLLCVLVTARLGPPGKITPSVVFSNYTLVEIVNTATSDQTTQDTFIALYAIEGVPAGPVQPEIDFKAGLYDSIALVFDVRNYGSLADVKVNFTDPDRRVLSSTESLLASAQDRGLTLLAGSVTKKADVSFDEGWNRAYNGHTCEIGEVNLNACVALGVAVRALDERVVSKVMYSDVDFNRAICAVSFPPKVLKVQARSDQILMGEDPRVLPAYTRLVDVAASDNAGLTNALEAAQPGDHIRLLGGSYAVDLLVKANGTFDKPITISGRNSAKCSGTIDVSGKYVGVYNLDCLGRVYLRGDYDRFIDNKLSVTCAADEAMLSVLSPARGIQVAYNSIGGLPARGLYFELSGGTFDDTVVECNYFHDISNSEAILIGRDWGDTNKRANIVARRNVFDNVNSSLDVMTIKCRGAYTYENTFINCGYLSVAQGGDTNLVANSFFNSTGIRLADRDNLVVNNALNGGQVLVNTGTLTADTWAASPPDFNTGKQSPAAYKNLVAGNTGNVIVGNQEGGYGGRNTVGADLTRLKDNGSYVLASQTNTDLSYTIDLTKYKSPIVLNASQVGFNSAELYPYLNLSPLDIPGLTFTSGAPRLSIDGLLIEQARDNRAPQSSGMWGLPSDVTLFDAPNGEVSFPAGTHDLTLAQPQPCSAGTIWAHSIEVHAIANPDGIQSLRLSGRKIHAPRDGWLRQSFVEAEVGTSRSLTLQITCSSNVRIRVRNPVLEISDVPLTGVAGPLPASEAGHDLTPMSLKGTMLIEAFAPPKESIGAVRLQGPSSQAIVVQSLVGGAMKVTTNAYATPNHQTSWPENTPGKVAVSWNGSQIKLAVNGRVEMYPGSPGSSFNQLLLHNLGVQQWNQRIKRLEVYDFDYSDDDLRRLTGRGNTNHWSKHRGLNLTNWSSAWTHRPFVLEELQWVKAQGFNAIRLPLDPRVWQGSGPNTEVWKEAPVGSVWRVDDLKTFNVDKLGEPGGLDDAVRWATQLGLHVLIGFEQAPGRYSEGDEYYGTGYVSDNGYKIRALTGDDRRAPHAFPETKLALETLTHQWVKLTERYAAYAANQLSFECPVNKVDVDHSTHLRGGEVVSVDLSAGVWAYKVQRVLEAIRDVDPDRPVLSNGTSRGTAFESRSDHLKAGQSVCLREPIEFTRWGDPNLGVPFIDESLLAWPNTAEYGNRGSVENLSQGLMLPWINANKAGVPVVVSEFGCYETVKNRLRSDYLRDLISNLFNKQGIGWYYWQLEGTYGLLNSEKTNPTTALLNVAGGSVYDPQTSIGVGPGGKRLDLDLLSDLTGAF